MMIAHSIDNHVTLILSKQLFVKYSILHLSFGVHLNLKDSNLLNYSLLGALLSVDIEKAYNSYKLTRYNFTWLLIMPC